MPKHPKCGKAIPGGSRAGHCTGCCENFSGESSFEAHRQGEHPRTCGITEKHWQDDRGTWHYGPRFTDEQKREMGWAGGKE